jgi:hypothetical protein
VSNFIVANRGLAKLRLAFVSNFICMPSVLKLARLIGVLVSNFIVRPQVSVAGREGVWIVAEMVPESDGIVTERPFWLRPDGQWTGIIRASAAEMSHLE